jgi:hypothetical protein
MFSLSIQGGYCDIITIGRTAPYPLYFMHRSGRPVKRMTKWGPTPEHGEAGKDRDKASIRQIMESIRPDEERPR